MILYSHYAIAKTIYDKYTENQHAHIINNDIISIIILYDVGSPGAKANLEPIYKRLISHEIFIT